jgi:hypothetical protein
MSPTPKQFAIMTDLNKFERALIISALEYYILNKQQDLIAGGVPYREEMKHLFNKLTSTASDDK